MDNLKRSIDNNLDAIMSVNINPDDVDYNKLDSYNSFFKLIDSNRTSIVVAFDMCKKEIIYVSDRFFEIYGFSKKETKKMDQLLYREQFHPDDYIINEAGTAFLKFIMNEPADQRKDYTLIRDFRIKNENQKYIRLLSHEFVLETDKRGLPWLNMKLTDLSPIQDLERPASAVCRNLRTGEMVFSFEGKMYPSEKITTREKQIISLVADGKLSKEIADRLFISVNTVNNHRRNAIKKLKVSNSSEAVKLLLKMKLI